MELRDILLLFIIYAFLGWVLEVIFHVFMTGRFINRGMLNGPYCPIYAFGATSFGLLSKMGHFSYFNLFLISMLIGSVLELVTGFVLDKFFKVRYWDYSDLPLNIDGYISVEFSVIWGFIGIIFIDIINPFFEKIIGYIPETLELIIVIIGISMLAVDLAVTVADLLKSKKLIQKLAKEREVLVKISDGIGEDISKKTIDLINKNETEIKPKLLEYKNDLKETQENFSKQTKRRIDAYLLNRSRKSFNRQVMIGELVQERKNIIRKLKEDISKGKDD